MRGTRRLTIALIAATCLLAGVAIGLVIPRAAQITAASPDQTGRVDGTTARSAGRNVYSPDIRHDSYVRQEQLKLVEMLERQCRIARENCDLAKASREALERD
ncbi:hypothetical protein [Sphingomonas sp. LT1P40]|uniref:hypothetical protein n=1 Tax=Alteristakelama amylovorans TaxID=3096166 RepID=UPI002FC8E078